MNGPTLALIGFFSLLGFIMGDFFEDNMMRPSVKDAAAWYAILSAAAVVVGLMWAATSVPR